ncbi:MAG: M56 family metallopeptidase [Saccharolobus sp.]
MQSVTTYWWKYYFVSFFAILVIDLIISTLSVNFPYFFIIQIGLVFGLWYLISPLIMTVSFKMKRASQDLTSLVETISKEFNIKNPRVYVINDNFLNAFAFGNIIFRGIAITIPLIDALTQEELFAVLYHEIAHIKNYDPEIMISSMILISSVYATLTLYLPNVFLPLLLILYFIIMFPLIFFIHRRIEKRADITAVKRNPHITFWLESALVKIGFLSRSVSVNMLKYIPQFQIFLAKEFIMHNTIDQNGFWSFRTHPSLKERLEYLSEYEEQKTYYI